jgi:hypothetical protein
MPARSARRSSSAWRALSTGCGPCTRRGPNDHVCTWLTRSLPSSEFRAGPNAQYQSKLPGRRPRHSNSPLSQYRGEGAVAVGGSAGSLLDLAVPIGDQLRPVALAEDCVPIFAVVAVRLAQGRNGAGSPRRGSSARIRSSPYGRKAVIDGLSRIHLRPSITVWRAQRFSWWS